MKAGWTSGTTDYGNSQKQKAEKGRWLCSKPRRIDGRIRVMAIEDDRRGLSGRLGLGNGQLTLGATD